MSTAIAPAAINNPYAALAESSAAGKVDDKNTASAERFLTMLVTQLQNQDPLNPMDNAQITSQMAQINAVTGLEKVNESVKGLGSQILQMQALQGAALVGREVSVDGDRLVVREGIGRGAIELAGSATAATVEVLDSANTVVGRINLGARDAGVHNFQWPVGNKSGDAGYTFRVVAVRDETAVSSRTLMVDRVQSVSTTGGALTLSLAGSGSVAANDVVAFN